MSFASHQTPEIFDPEEAGSERVFGYTITQFARMHGYKSTSGIYAAIDRGDIPTYRPYPGADRHIPASWVLRQVEKR